MYLPCPISGTRACARIHRHVYIMCSCRPNHNRLNRHPSSTAQRRRRMTRCQRRRWSCMLSMRSCRLHLCCKYASCAASTCRIYDASGCVEHEHPNRTCMPPQNLTIRVLRVLSLNHACMLRMYASRDLHAHAQQAQTHSMHKPHSTHDIAARAHARTREHTSCTSLQHPRTHETRRIMTDE